MPENAEIWLECLSISIFKKSLLFGTYHMMLHNVLLKPIKCMKCWLDPVCVSNASAPSVSGCRPLSACPWVSSVCWHHSANFSQQVSQRGARSAARSVEQTIPAGIHICLGRWVCVRGRLSELLYFKLVTQDGLHHDEEALLSHSSCADPCKFQKF